MKIEDEFQEVDLVIVEGWTSYSKWVANHPFVSSFAHLALGLLVGWYW